MSRVLQNLNQTPAVRPPQSISTTARGAKTQSTTVKIIMTRSIRNAKTKTNRMISSVVESTFSTSLIIRDLGASHSISIIRPLIYELAATKTLRRQVSIRTSDSVS